MKVFITGGCKNGKSTFALGRATALAGEGPRTYVATLLPRDAEERRCVENHRRARAGLGYTTRELPLFPSEALAETGGRGVFLLDSVTALLANHMFPPEREGPVPEAGERVRAELARFLERAEHAVLVSDYIGSDGMDYSPLTECFRRELAETERFLAARCDAAAEVCCGIPIWLKQGSANRK